jgi:hypothetical protein
MSGSSPLRASASFADGLTVSPAEAEYMSQTRRVLDAAIADYNTNRRKKRIQIGHASFENESKIVPRFQKPSPVFSIEQLPSGVFASLKHPKLVQTIEAVEADSGGVVFNLWGTGLHHYKGSDIKRSENVWAHEGLTDPQNNEKPNPVLVAKVVQALRMRLGS